MIMAHASSQDTCRIYFAPSTIPGAGNGMYSVVDVPAKEILRSSPSLSYFVGSDGYFAWGAVNSYQWNGEQAKYVPAGAELVPGLGCLVNHHQEQKRVNLEEMEAQPGLTYDRRTSPAAGAQTERHDWGFRVINKINAGDEVRSPRAPSERQAKLGLKAEQS